jgi:hypothetical protein
VLNRGWKRDSLEIMIFVYVCSTWSIVEVKTRFETWITRNDVNDVSLFNLCYLITLMTYMCSQRTTNVQINNFMFDWSICRLFVLNTGWKRDCLQMMIFVMFSRHEHGFETSITISDVNCVSFFHLSYLVTLIAYLCSQWTPNVQIKCFMIDWC